MLFDCSSLSNSPLPIVRFITEPLRLLLIGTEETVAFLLDKVGGEDDRFLDPSLDPSLVRRVRTELAIDINGLFGDG
jgi:hypothetical protein